MAENQQKRISRERRKRLLRRLKSEVGPHKRDLYIAAVLSWIFNAYSLIFPDCEKCRALI